MANNVHLTAFFIKKAKRLLKKYSSLQSNLSKLEKDLIDNPHLGIITVQIYIRSGLRMNLKEKVKAAAFV